MCKGEAGGSGIEVKSKGNMFIEKICPSLSSHLFIFIARIITTF